MPLGARIWIAALAVLLSCAAVADPASEQLSDLSEQLKEEPFELTADSLHYDIERELYIGRGNVVIKQSGRTLRADWVAFNRKTGAGLASGNVQLEDRGDVVTADFVEFELETIEGVLHGARLESETSRFRASAAEIAKTGPNTYSFREGRFTTCRCPDPSKPDPWVLESEEAELEVEGYATARNTTFEVFGVPVAWIPWMIFPVKTERQTGFLFPEFSLGSFHGFDFGLPFFWAINDQAGLVLTPRYSVVRGPGGAARFDYAAGEHTDGQMQAAYYHDEKIDPDTPEEPYGRNRWSTHGVHDWSLPSHLRFETNYRFASDNDVPFDFRELEAHRNDRFLESEGVLSRSLELGRTYASVGATFVDDLQNPDNLDRDRFLLQRWPTARVDVLPGGVPGASFLVPSFDVEYTRFAARKRAESELTTAQVGERGLFLDTGVDALPNPLFLGATHSELGPLPDPYQDDFATFGGTEGDGLFQEGEPLTDRGHRLMLQPRVAVPLDWRGISLVPEVGWHETLYDSRVRDFRERGFVTTRIDLSTRLRRQFEHFVHVLEPRAGYALAYTHRSQDGNALFVPATAVPLDRIRALDLDLVTRDDADRVARASRATAGFGNRIYGMRANGARAMLADVTMLGLYDAESTRFDALIVDGRTFPMDQLDVGFHADFDPDAGRFDEGFAEARWNYPGLAFNAGYRWAREIPLFFEDFKAGDRFEDHSDDAEHINQVRGGVSLDLTARWSVSYGAAYSIEGNRLLANQGLIEYLSRCGCWSLGVELKQDRERGVDAKLVYRLVGLGGEPPTPRPSLLDGT